MNITLTLTLPISEVTHSEEAVKLLLQIELNVNVEGETNFLLIEPQGFCFVRRF